VADATALLMCVCYRRVRCEQLDKLDANRRDAFSARMRHAKDRVL
jgi:hypothetical protein